MTGKALWQSLKQLVECDKQIINASKDILALQKNVETNAAESNRLKSLINDFKHRIAQEQKNIDFYELQAREIQDNEVSKRTHLDNIKNQKEYKAFEKEIAQLSNQRKEIDELLVQAYYRMDAEKEKIAKEHIAYTNKIEQLTKESEEKTVKLQELETQQNALQTKRQEMATQIPAEWITRYERMRHSVSDPIVPVLNDNCSACYYSILYQDLVKLKKSGILLCRNCYRFLYYDEEEQQDSQNSSY